MQTLAILNIKGETLLNSSLRDIIIKAQPHHSYKTLLHLTREQLIAHVDALVEWWKMANPSKAVSFGVISPDMVESMMFERYGLMVGRSVRSYDSFGTEGCCCVIV